MKNYCILPFLVLSFFLLACNNNKTGEPPVSDQVSTPADSIMPGKRPGDPGVRMIPIRTDHGTFNVWTKKEGQSDDVKVLFLHGGPAATHEYFEIFSDYLPQEGFEIYYYDQLGSYYSDQPDNDDLWRLDRFVEEVEQVRKALGLTKDNFYIIGNSWGGILGMEYALKYQEHLNGLVISNMMGSFDDYEEYNEELRSQMRPSLIDSLKVYEAKGDYHNPEYQELVFNEFYTKHLCRLEEWPEPVTNAFAHLNQHVYELMQGPSEFVPGGRLKGWTVMDRLQEIEVPTLMVAARYDTMDPAHKKRMSELVQHGRYHYCPEGSHLAMWDDPENYFQGVIKFIRDVEAGTFK